MKLIRSTSFVWLIISTLFLGTCKGGGDKKCKDETDTGTIYISTDLLSGSSNCGSPLRSMLEDYKYRMDNAFTDSKTADSQWYIEFRITGICDDEKDFRIVKQGPTEAIPIEMDGMLYFKMTEIPINRDLTISSMIITPCFMVNDGCCINETNGRSEFVSGQTFNQVVDEEQLNVSMIEAFFDCGCTL